MNIRSMFLSSIAAGLVLITAVSAEHSQPSSSSQSTSDRLTLSAVQSSMPVAFTKNMGQWPDSILYRADGGGGTMWFTKDGIYYQFTRRIAKAEASAMRDDAESPEMLGGKFGHERDSIEMTMIKAAFVGSSSEVEVVGLDELAYKCNYFTGNEPSNWHTDVPNFSGVTYRNLYPGVDASFGAIDGRMECRLTAASDAALAQVQVEYLGSESVTNSTDGISTIQTAFGEMRFAGVMPVAEGEGRETVKSSAEAASGGLVVVYGTYLGGAATDEGHGIVVDENGCAYVTGLASSSTFPIVDPYQTHQGNADIFVTKLSSDASSLLYSTFVGGDQVEGGKDIAIDGAGNVYVTGQTSSSDFPTVGFSQPLLGIIDAIVFKLSPSGNSLIYSKYLGGSDRDYGYSIAIDTSGSAYLTGNTVSSDFPLQNPFQAMLASTGDAFVAKLSVDGGSLIYSTYLGGGNSDVGRSIAVDASGSACVVGDTWSPDFPTANAFQPANGGSYGSHDAFVVKFSLDGNSLVYGTYLGGLYYDGAYGVALGEDGSAYVVGHTSAEGFPLVNPLQSEPGDENYYDIFLTRFSADGSSLHFSTYIGGPRHDFANSVALDDSGNIYIAGYHDTGLWPSPSALSQPQWYMNDVFVAAVSADGGSLLYSGFFTGRYGSDALEEAHAIAVDGDGNAYVTGYTTTGSLPFPDPYQTYQDGGDAFVVKLMNAYVDTDIDGLLDVNDNCPFLSNPGQEDSNNDGIGDACCCTAARGNVNGSSGETPDLSDLSFLISYLTQTPRPTLFCPNEANVNGAGGIDLSDLTVMISYLTETPAPTLPNCP